MDRGRVEYSFFWLVENFSYSWHKNGEKLSSPKFIAHGLDGTAWRIMLYPRGEYDEDESFISLYLARMQEDEGSDDEGNRYISIKYELSILAEDGSTVSKEDYEGSFERDEEYVGLGFVKLDEKLFKKHFPRDALTVLCRMWVGEGKVQRVARICARTRIGIEHVSFLHEVENFSKLKENVKNSIEIRSLSKKQAFGSSSLCFSRGSCPEGEMVVEITTFENHHVLCKRKISLLDGSGNAILCAQDDNRFDPERKDIRKLSLSLSRQEILNKKNEYLPGDKLSLLCECSFSTGLEYEKIEEIQHEMPTEAAQLASHQQTFKNDAETQGKASAYPGGLEDMRTLYVNKSLTDVELKTKSKSFPAHKLVLCARSPVFNRMLTSDMREKNTDCIQVDDLEEEVVGKFLLFLYSDTVENLEWTMVTRLYYAADKYEVGRLKEVCSSFLVANLSPAKAGEVLLLSDTHSDGHLKNVVEDYILEHEEEVYGSDEWEGLLEANPLLVVKAMHLKYKRKKSTK